MTPERSSRTAARLSLATVLVMFALIVVGSIVRTTGSGLACPDWPLCHGKLIPPFEFNVLIEWFHRLLALVTSLLLGATVGWIVLRRELRSRLLPLASLAVGLLVCQILLGALTVWKLLHPAVVGSHLATALLLFSVMVVLTRVAFAESVVAGGRPAERPAPRPPGLLPMFGIVTAMVYSQAVMGGIVSSHHAGLACPDWPTCNGEWFPALEGGVGLQMMHRFGAYLVVAAVLAVWIRSRACLDARARRAATGALVMTLVQVLVGISNVWMRTPVWLSAVHLALAAGLLAHLIGTTFRVGSLPAPASDLAAEPS
jgi:cytochrome c oxidase assembly protein subunit 15